MKDNGIQHSSRLDGFTEITQRTACRFIFGRNEQALPSQSSEIWAKKPAFLKFTGLKYLSTSTFDRFCDCDHCDSLMFCSLQCFCSKLEVGAGSLWAMLWRPSRQTVTHGYSEFDAFDALGRAEKERHL